MATNWQEQLAAFRQQNPDLPEGTAEAQVDSGSDTVEHQPRLDVGIERKGRAGKTATLITGWVIDDDQLCEVASVLKQRLGCGGSARGGDILIQGDRRDKVVELLAGMGYKARKI